MKNNLTRFTTAQEKIYAIARSEIKSGRKQSHWMWYIFPQIKGLGFSDTAKFYEIKSKEEAQEYLDHPILGTRLREITLEILTLNEDNATSIFGYPDDLKLKSCMTLFSLVDGSEENIFDQVLRKLFHSKNDKATLAILKSL